MSTVLLCIGLVGAALKAVSAYRDRAPGRLVFMVVTIALAVALGVR